MEKEAGALQALADFRQATMQLDNVYSIFSKSCGLSEAEYWSLLLMYEGLATQSQISGQLFLSRQTLNSAFKQLQKKGLIRLEPCRENQRTKQAFFTDNGKQFVEETVARMHQVEEQAWRRLGQEEQEALTGLTRKFSRFILQELEAEKWNTM